MEEVVGSAAVEIGKCACAPLKECTGYVTHFNNNVKDLKDCVQDLVARKEHIDRLVSTGCSNGEEETPEVKLWLTRAAELIQKAGTVQQKVAENKGCLHCLNLRWRYSISKQAKQMTDSIITHIGKVNPDNIKMTMPQSLPTVIIEEAPSIQGLPSVESSLQEVMSALRDENTKIIGVLGMGGVAKTTLVKNANNKLYGTQQFKKVIMVTVSKDADIKKIQEDIAKRMGFKLQDDTESSRAIDLSSRLMKEERFLIILDDLWEPLVLAEVGIPSPTILKDCKIIFTTRNKDVCKGMESQVDIQVKVLSDEESWKLFKDKAGVIVDDPSFHTKAREVFKECAGLPLAIITLGRALRGERDPRVWDNALSQLKKSAPRNIKEMEKGVYQSIKISYERLQAELKLGFLFCCLFPEDHDIHVDTMIRLWKGEGFLEDVESWEEALNKGHALVEELKSSCLLLAGEKEGYVKMHDIIRDVAIWISSKECEDCKSFVRIGLKGLPQGKSWEEYKRISIRRCGINKLPEGMHCPKLVTLMMPGNEEPIEIQGGFWEATKELRVLDLSYTLISKIPLANLVNLRVLCLRSCKFEEGNCLSALGGLKQLEFLDLSFNYWLCELPNEIRELVNLRSLDLTNTFNLKIVPSGVISRLTLLEELKMWNSFHEWKAEEKDASSGSSSNACLSEVASLKELSNLHLWIVQVERLPRDYPLIKHLTKLKNFCFCICPRPDYGRVQRAYPESNRDELRYMEIVGCSLIPEWALMLLPQTTHLKLKNCKGQEALNRGGRFPILKSLTVEECDDVEFVVSAKESPENAFGNLQSLELRNLPNLKKVLTKYEEGLLPTLLFHNLKKLEVYDCPKLKHLLPSVLLQGMDNLTKVRVSYCGGMEHLFDGPPTVEQRNDVLSKLETLALSDLTSMTSIWPMGLVVNLQNLATLDVWGCHGLKKSVVSAMQMKGGLPNLYQLYVFHCEGVEEIISDVVDNEGLLPKLRTLGLTDLPTLVRICGGEADPLLQLGWNSLEQIRVWRCGGMEHAFEGPPNDVFFKLKTSNLKDLHNLTTLELWRCHFFKKTVISSVQMKGGLPNLVNLTVNDCGGVEEIISDVVDNEGLLPKLKFLRLSFLPELVRIYGGGEAVPPRQLDWHSLKIFYVYGCPKLKKVQPLQGGADSVPSLRKTKGERNWLEGLDWGGNDRVISQFHSLFKEVLTDDED
ncbi:probable disease resistance protein At4g27220 isoform X2 [Magnolia sinica]|uniref:probable disease resistance protein At4g27220 isoform X2 n=1 Tax=Magnolia sinica TaxID=86752 RepID=UPI002657C0CC|nr:probable disease resistance protein At4g27220 isoform X2 [Magnolia sinica]XP_058074905.1 probable disease resistance protein At4g27220 isoform X2 [Magnolia sinica]